jgi:hypothetical protein
MIPPVAGQEGNFYDRPTNAINASGSHAGRQNVQCV